MAHFSKLKDFKNSVVDKLLESQEIRKALKYGSSDFLGQPDVADPSELLYTHVFPHAFTPEFLGTPANTYLSVSFRKFGAPSNVSREGFIHIAVFAHHTLFKTDYGTTRTDFLVHKIDERLNKAEGFGLGRLEWSEMEEFTVNSLFSGSSLAYRLADFQ